MSHKKIAIVGGGIAGLTMAIALQRTELDVTVYESTPHIKPVGAGLTLAGNAVKALNQIGIADDVLRIGKVLKTLRIKDTRGRTLVETDAEKLSAALGVINSFSVHRADLHEVLLSRLQPGTVQLRKSVKHIAQTDHCILAFTDGTQAEADFVIACDGIHSAVRSQLIPRQKPRYAGYTCWRAVITHTSPHHSALETSETWGKGKRFGIVPLTDERIYWFACINADQNNHELKSYRIPDLLAEFADFPPIVSDVLKHTHNDQLIWGDITDLKPLKKFAFGKILLTGDAAHATTPNMGQGACMAIEDAAILANCIGKTRSLDHAFLEFESRRIARTTKIVNDSWRIGKVAQWENGILAAFRNLMIRLTPTSVTEKQIRFITDVEL